VILNFPFIRQWPNFCSIPSKLQFFDPKTTVSCGDLLRYCHHIIGMKVNELNYYCIKIKGEIDTCWQDWFDGMAIASTDDGNTILSSGNMDQAALHGVLKKIRDLGLPIISVIPNQTIRKETK
jgi:hypothetical protein